MTARSQRRRRKPGQYTTIFTYTYTYVNVQCALQLPKVSVRYLILWLHFEYGAKTLVSIEAHTAIEMVVLLLL